ncbi:MAG: hypothetical protein AAGH15_02055 [Myxococcota bacterium]
MIVLWPLLATAARPSLPPIDPWLEPAKRAAGRPIAPPPGARGMQVEARALGDRRYLEVLLGTAPGDRALPMVVFLHGRGDGPRIPTGDYREGEPVRLILPYAPTPLGDGFSWFGVSILEGRDAALAEALADAKGELVAFLEALRARHATRGLPILTGFSQGGMLTLALALEGRGRIAEAVPMAAWIPDGALAGGPAVRIRGLHGEADEVVGFAPARALYGRLRARGVDARLESFPDVPHRMSEAMKARHTALLVDALGRLP